ncbi:MAG: GH92 family glycosyl hydrolase [Bacteroidales bacterium]|nr:GH92 family glycosyl hydrolase [Bacteroidales bacterium]
MKRLVLSLVALCLSLSVVAQSNKMQYVNPFIGTNGMGHTFPGACYPYGSVQLSPDTDTIPHNVNGVYQPRAYDYCAGYQYRDNTIVGFSHTHFSGTGHSDLGDFLIMPYSGATKLNPGTKEDPDGGYRQRFRHETEVARPGYYAVTLDDDNIRCELTATPHCGVHRYIFPKGAAQKIVLDLNHGIYNYDGKTLWAQCNVTRFGIDRGVPVVKGYRITNGWSRTNYTYFAVTFNKEIKRYGCHDFGQQDYRGGWAKFDTEHDFPEMGGRKLVTWFEFEDDGNETLEIFVGLSATSMEAAFGNLVGDQWLQDKNTGKKVFLHNFDKLLSNTESVWRERLSAIECNGSADQQAMLYTSLYHTLINPSLYQDAKGTYRGVDQEIHQSSQGRTNYTVFSLWDTYRALHPLLTLLDTTLVKDVLQSFSNHFSQSPHHMLPVWSHMGSENWCMVGYHGVSVLTDALQKGLLDDLFSAEALPSMVIASSNCDYYGNTDAYKELGFVPVDKNRSGTSITLENAYEDWTIYMCMKQMGEEIHRLAKEQNTADWGTEEAERIATMEQEPYLNAAEIYLKRAMSYRNVFDTTIGFARARYSDSSWKQDYSLLSTSEWGLVEGNAWNYSFYVPHDVNGLMRLMGGEKRFVEKLDTLFTMHVPDEFFAETEDVTREGMLGGYVQGNEPSHHIPYLYMWTSQPWKTQYWVREIMNKMYRNHIDGLCGNDDCGQMSAWYIFSAMGFYPVCPGSGEYVIGAPYMPYMKVRLANGKSLEIKAPKVSDKNRYIQSVRLNGKPHRRTFFTHKEIMEGAVVEFEMGSKPNRKWFEEKPYSMGR